MTETQAKSGGSGTSATPVDEEPNGAEKAGREAASRDAAGRAAVPADAPTSPPGEPAADKDGSSEAKRPAPPAGVAKGSATVPIVTKGKSGGQGGPGNP